MTLKRVAELSGVSIKTASRALGGEAAVSEQTRRRIEDAAARIGYVPNRAARTMRTGRTGLFGLIAHGATTSPFTGEILRGIETGIEAADGALLITDSATAGLRRSRSLIAEFRPDAVIFVAGYHRSADAIFEPGCERSILVNCRSADHDLPAFVPDDEGGGRLQAEHLLSLGHRRLGMIELPKGMLARGLRRRGAFAAIRAAGLDPSTVPAAPGQDGPAHARRMVAFEAATTMLSRPGRPTALLCSKDEYALQAIAAAFRLGLRVPEEVSVIGFDDLRVIAETMRPGLTTVALPYFEMGHAAARTASGEPDAGPTPIPCRLVMRESCAPPSGPERL